MTQKQINQIMSQIPEGETYSRGYRAFEGDYRVITKDAKETEHRYQAIIDADGNVGLKPF